jgi:hypothetical protein
MKIKSFEGILLYTNLSKRDAQSATALIDLGGSAHPASFLSWLCYFYGDGKPLACYRKPQ